MTDTARSLRQSERLAKRAAADSAPATEKAGLPVTKKAKTEVKPQKSNVEHLNVGGSLPDGIVLDDQTGQKVNVSDIVKTGTVVIFAYPKASTPGCTKQACGFRDKYPQFEQAGVKVFGLSADSVKAQEKFHSKQKLTYKLLSDPEYKLIELLGAKKTAKGGIIRSHWIFKDGKIIVSAVQISPADSFTKALEQVQGDQVKEDVKEDTKEEVKTDSKEGSESTKEANNVSEPSTKEEPVSEPTKEEPVSEPKVEAQVFTDSTPVPEKSVQSAVE